MSINLKAGEKIPLFLLLENRATDRVVRATVRNEFGVEISGSPKSVAHLSDGEYFDNALAMPNTGHIMVIYDVFDGPGFTNLSNDLFPEVERFDLDDLATAIEELKNAARQADLGAEITDNEILAGKIEDSDDLDAQVTDKNQLVGKIGDVDELKGQIDNDNDLIVNVDC